MGVNKTTLSKSSGSDVRGTHHHLVVPNSFLSHSGPSHLFQSNMLPWRLAGSEGDAVMEEMHSAVSSYTRYCMSHKKESNRRKGFLLLQHKYCP